MNKLKRFCECVQKRENKCAILHKKSVKNKIGNVSGMENKDKYVWFIFFKTKTKVFLRIRAEYHKNS